MMFSFLTRQNEDRRVADTLSALTQMSEKVEFLSTQILKSVGTDEAKLMSELYDVMNDDLKNSLHLLHALDFFILKPTPKAILRLKNFGDFVPSMGSKKLTIVKSGDVSMGRTYNEFIIDPDDYKKNNDEYLKLRKRMIEVLSKYKISLDDFLKR